MRLTGTLIRFINTYNKFWENFISLSILQFFDYFIPLLLLPYLVRVIKIEKFGLLAFATSFITLLQIISDYGFNLFAPREVAFYRNNKEKIKEIVNSVLACKLLLTLLCFILLTIVIISFEKLRVNWIIYYLTFGTMLGQTIFPIWFFQGMEEMKYITFLNIFAKAFYALLVFMLVKTQGDYWKVPLFNSGANIFASLLALYFMKRHFGIILSGADFNNIKKYLIDSFPFFISRISVSIYTSVNTFILGLCANNQTVGNYSIAERIYNALRMIYHPLAQTLYPYVAYTRNKKFFFKIFSLAIYFNIFLVTILFIFDRKIFYLAFSHNFSNESIIAFKIFLVTLLVTVPSIIIGYPFLAGMGYPRYANISVIYGSFAHLFGLLLLYFTNFLNIYTIVVMTFFTETFVLIYRVYFYLKISKMSYG